MVAGGGEQETREAQLLASGDFAFHVQLGGGIVAYKHRGEAGVNIGAAERRDVRLQLSVNLIANGVSVEDPCGQCVLPQRKVCASKA